MPVVILVVDASSRMLEPVASNVQFYDVIVFFRIVILLKL